MRGARRMRVTVTSTSTSKATLRHLELSEATGVGLNEVLAAARESRLARDAGGTARVSLRAGVLVSALGGRVLKPTWLAGFQRVRAALSRALARANHETIQNKGTFATDHWNFRISREQQHCTQSLLTVRGPLQQDVAVQEAPIPFRESAGHGVPASFSGRRDWFFCDRALSLHSRGVASRHKRQEATAGR